MSFIHDLLMDIRYALRVPLLGLAACAIPARRACAVDPCKLMRQE